MIWLLYKKIFDLLSELKTLKQLNCNIFYETPDNVEPPYIILDRYTEENLYQADDHIIASDFIIDIYHFDYDLQELTNIANIIEQELQKLQNDKLIGNIRVFINEKINKSLNKLDRDHLINLSMITKLILIDTVT